MIVVPPTFRWIVRAGRRGCAALLWGLVAAAPALAQPAAATQSPPDLSGFWEPRAGSRQAPQPPKLTPQAQRINETGAARQRETGGLDETDFYCVPPGMPWIMFQSAPINIVQTSSKIAVTNEVRGFPRHIYLDGRAHPDPSARELAINGHSVGRWEGDTLVVDTVGFSPRGAHGPVGNTPRTPLLHILERYRLRTPDELFGTVRIEDPNILLEPYEFSFVWYRSSPETYALETTCDPRAYRDRHK